MRESPDKSAILHTLFLFEGLPEEARRTFFSSLSESECFEKGAVIYSTRTFRRAMGVILSGEVRVYRSNEAGGRLLMNRLEPGDTFGVAALFGGGDSYVTDIVAARRSQIQFIRQEQITAMMRKEALVAENYICFLSDRIRFLNDRISGLSGGPAHDRLLLFLRSHADPNGAVLLPGGMTALSQLLDIGRSSLYRSLDSLEQAGLLRREGKTIYLLSKGDLIE